MIEPVGFRGAAFGDGADGDPRTDGASRARFHQLLATPEQWSWPHQVHGGTVLRAQRPGPAGDGDGLITSAPLAVAVATADCVPVILEGDTTTAVIHAGWRGMAAGVVAAGVAAMEASGDTPRRAAIGPSIGPCCYEVGPEVVAAVPFAATTTWGTTSVDLWSAAESQLGDIEVWRAGVCTYTDERYRSHRRDGTPLRQVAVTWLPGD